jgi:hypothetical protein
MEYKNIEVKELNGFKVTSRTIILTEEEEQKKLAEINALITKIYLNYIKDKTEKEDT